MPKIKSAKKNLRKSAKRHQSNVKRMGNLKDIYKKIKKLSKEGKEQEAKNLIPQAYKAIDKAAKNKVIKKNSAARKKSQVMKVFKQK